MSCFSPLVGYQHCAGAPLRFGESAYKPISRRVVVPCGQCHGCRLDRSAAMGIRCVHEASLYEHNQFVTLTYEKSPGTLVPRDLQLFFKRLRRVQPFRFYSCGEYGDVNGRPHYHAVLFNFPCHDRYYWRKSSSGFDLFRSPGLEHVWGHGSVEVGDVSFQSAAYVARYVMKKQSGVDVGPRREIVDVTSGELVYREHEFMRCSLKPGIGAEWYQRYSSDVYPRGFVVSNGKKWKCPKYYDVKYKAEFPDLYEQLVAERLRKAEVQFADNSPARLRVKEIVERAKCSFLKRGV